MYKTNKLFYVVGIQRGGIHSICNFLLQQEPLLQQTQQLQDYGQDVWGFKYNGCHYLLFNYRFFHEKELKCPPELLKNIKCIAHAVIVFEIAEIESFKTYYEDKDEIFGNIVNEYNVISLRRLPDFLASWYAQKRCIPSHIIPHYKSRLLEILGQTNYIPQKYFINYNKWFTDIDYRKQICKDLDLIFTDYSINDVSFFGGGSSFDGLSMNNCASKMKVNERWKRFRQDPYFIYILKQCNDLLQLSNYIFNDTFTINDNNELIE